MSINLKKYKDSILVAEDKLLFMEVEKCVKADALRAAYILTWIACAESLKRRFKEAAKRDHLANKVVGEIQSKESLKKAVDHYLLDEAEKYGFLNAAEKAKLDHVLTFRSVYAHPYEAAPSEEELLNAISSVVNHVLSQPVKLKHGFISGQLKEVFSNPHFLDDLEGAVSAYANEILPKISEDLYSYMLDRLFEESEKNIGDASMHLFTRRAMWIASSVVKKCLPHFSANDWHALVNKYPRTAPYILLEVEHFDKIGNKAQDSVVSHLLTVGQDSPSALTFLEALLEKEMLSERQEERFIELIDKFGEKWHNSKSADKLKASGLKLKTCFFTVIAHFKSNDWYTQNPIATMVSHAGVSQISALTEDQQVELGRNVLQAADGSSSEANALLTKITEAPQSWPTKFVYGILVECFVNEKNQFRFKTGKFDKVQEILKGLDANQCSSLLGDLMIAIEPSEMKHKFDKEEDLEQFIEKIKTEAWSKSFCKYLQKSIPTKIKAKQKKAAA